MAPHTDKIAERALLACAGFTVVAAIGIGALLAVEAVRFFSEVSIAEFFASARWQPEAQTPAHGVWPLVTGTMLTAGIAALIAVPTGLFAAIYLSELASLRTRRTFKPILEVLAGIPTIVYGYFALAFVTPVLQSVVPGTAMFNALSPGIVLGLMVAPMISCLADDALYAVPGSVREGAYALGASRMATALRIVVPTARSGIIAAVVLAMSRAVGETMIVTLAAGNTPALTLDPRVPIETMTSFIVGVGTERAAPDLSSVFAVAALLFAVTLAMNSAAHRLSRRFRRIAA